MQEQCQHQRKCLYCSINYANKERRERSERRGLVWVFGWKGLSLGILSEEFVLAFFTCRNKHATNILKSTATTINSNQNKKQPWLTCLGMPKGTAPASIAMLTR